MSTTLVNKVTGKEVFPRIHIQVITATKSGELLYDGFWLIDNGLTREEITEHIQVTRPRIDSHGSRCFVWAGIVFPFV